MVKTKEKSDKSGIQVIARAAAILRVLKAAPQGASLGEIATSVGLPRSTVQRIVGALQAERLVISNPGRRGLRLGPEISALAGGMRHDMVETCRALLAALAEKTGETADLSVMRGAGMVFLDQVSGRSHRLRTVSSVGEVFPLTTPANGRACLAALPRDQAKQLIAEEWRAAGVRGDMAALCQKLDQTSTERLAYDLSEHTPGIAAIGFAFADEGGELYAISVPVPMTRLTEVRAKVEDALLETARHIDEIIV